MTITLFIPERVVSVKVSTQKHMVWASGPTWMGLPCQMLSQSFECVTMAAVIIDVVYSNSTLGELKLNNSNVIGAFEGHLHPHVHIQHHIDQNDRPVGSSVSEM